MEDALTPAKKSAPDIASLRRMFEEASDQTKTSRLASQRCDDYYHGHQLTREEKNALAARRQPDGIFNRVRPAVEGMLGVLKQGETDPRAYPRNPQDEDSADVASKVLRYIADKNDFDALKLEGAKNFLVEGTCAAIVEVDEERQVTIQPIRWEEFFYDPRSRRKDFSDARYMGIAKWRYADEIAAEYPDAKKDLENVLEGGIGAVDDTFEDRPTDTSTTVAWVDAKKRRVMQVELYHKEGARWFRCCYHAGGVLAYDESAYVDEKGRSLNPIEAQSCYVDRENNRTGVVNDMIPVQDEINKRRSKLLHLVTTSQVQAADGNFAQMEDADLVRKEAARPDGVIPPGWEKVPTNDMAAGQAQLLAEAKAEIERLGPAPDILGRQSADASGRAQLVRQQAGMTQFAMVFGGIEDWELRLYRQMWARARQFWQQPMWVRVTDDEGAPEFVGLNMPPGMADPQTGEPVPPNPIAQMDVDIILDSVPDTANVQQEQFQILAELAKFYPQDVTFDDLLETSSMPNKRAILEKRKARAEQAGQQQDPARELQMRGAVAEVAKVESEAELNRAKTQTELAKPAIEAAKLEQAEQKHQTDAAFRGAEMVRGDQERDTEAQFRAAEMQRGDAQRETDTGFRAAELAQKDRQFDVGTASKERLAAMKPPPGSQRA